MDITPDAPSQVKNTLKPLFEGKGWIKLVGVLSIIAGALQVLSCWGIIIAWLPIWMGIVLLSAVGSLERAYLNEQEQDIQKSMNGLRKYFKLLGIFIIVSIVLGIILFIAALIIPLLARQRMQ